MIIEVYKSRNWNDPSFSVFVEYKAGTEDDIKNQIESWILENQMQYSISLISIKDGTLYYKIENYTYVLQFLEKFES